MITFVLEREFYNKYGTYGELSESTTGFKCKTIEKVPPKEGDTPYQLARKALPCGTYDLQNVYLPFENRNTFKLMIRGNYSRACFQLETIVNPGDIVLSRTHSPGTYAAESKIVLDAINMFIEEKMSEGEISPMGKRGYVQLLVKECDTYHKESLDLDESKPTKEMNWNLIDDDWWENEE